MYTNSMLRESARHARSASGNLWVLKTLAFLLLGASTVVAQDDVWIGPDGQSSWFTPESWKLVAPPTIEQNAIVENGTTAQVDAVGAVAATLTIDDGSTVQILPRGELTLDNPLVIGRTGTFLFSGGTVLGNFSWQNNGTIEIAAQANLSANISGNGAFELNIPQAGTLSVFSSNNTYGGTTTLTDGTFQAGSLGAISPNSAFIVNSILDLNGFSASIASLSGTGTVLNGGPTTVALTLGNDNSDSSFGGTLSGPLQLIKSGTGTLVLTGSNTYTGGTTISAGTLQLGDGQGTGSITGDVIDNGILAFNRNNDLTFAGAISGTGGVLQNGTGTATLTGANTYSGGTTINVGTLAAGSETAFSPNSAFIVNSLLDLNGFNNTIGSLSGTGTVLNNGAGVAALTAGNDNTDSTFSGVLADGGDGVGILQLIKSGSGTLMLTGANTYTGGTTINSGTLQLGNGGATGSISDDVVDNGTLAFNRSDDVTFGGAISGTGTVVKLGSNTLVITGANTYTGGTTISSGTLQLGDGGAAGSITGDVIDNGTLAFNRSDDVTFGGAISGTGTVVKLGSNTLIITGANTYTGGTTISAGTLQLGDGGATGSITGDVIDNGTLAFSHTDDVTFAGVITGTGSVLQNGTGTTTLTGANTYSGGTTINVGTLAAGSETAFSRNSAFTVNSLLDLNGFNSTIGSLSGTGIVLNNGAGVAALTVGNDNTDSTFSGVLTDGGNGVGVLQLIKSGSGSLILTGANTYTGGTTISSGTLQLGGGGATGSITGDVIDNGTLAFNRSDDVTFEGVISGTGSILQNGTGTTTLTGANTYSGGTTINVGTLAAGSETAFSPNSAFTVNTILNLNGFNNTIGSLSGTGTVLNNGAGAAALTVGNDNANTIFDGILEDGASPLGLIKSGSGTLSLTGNNTYSGATTVSAGRLQADSATALSPNSAFTVNAILDLNGFNNIIGSLSGTGMVLNNGATTASLTVGNDNNNSTFNGVLADGVSSLQLIKSGTGTLALTGNNIYTGGTTILAGTLQIGIGGTTGSIAGNVADNGTLAFNRSDSVTFGGDISGTGGVVNLGPGSLILTGTNTYTGLTTINAGTLQVGDGGATGSIVGNVVDNGTLAFNRSDTVTYAGAISGTGNVVKMGTGTLILPGISTYTGSTTVDSGSLIVDGSLASTETVINPGGSLGGHGTIGGNLVNNGTMGQSNSPGTLTVANNYTQTNSGILRIGVAGVAANQHDLVAVNGHAALAGTLQLFPLTGFNLQPGDQLTFLTAKNGVSGSFANVQSQLVSTGTILQALVTSLPDSVVLEAVQGSFASTPGVAQTPNQQQVAKALDSAVGNPKAAPLLAFLNNQPLANLPADLELIAPTQLTSINATAVSVSDVQISNISQRLANVHAGSTGFSSSGFSLNGGTATFADGFAGVTGSEGKSAPAVFAPTPDNRWGLFATGLGEFTNVDSTPNAAGYNVDTGGFTFGVDYRLTPNFALGLTAGYAHTTVSLDGGGNIDVNGGKIGAYATLFANSFYLDAAISGGPSGYTTRRTALQGTASGNTGGADLDVLVATGYDWKKGNLTVGPTASFQYNYVGLDSFSETGSLAPMKFPDQNTQSERSAFGARASYEWKVAHITILPQISAAWQHEYGATEYSVVASFANGAGSSFSVIGPEIGRDSLLVGAGATVILNERVSTYLYYDGEFARTNYLSNNVSGGFRISF